MGDEILIDEEELSSIPTRIKKTDGMFLDELVGELNGMGYNYEDSNELLSDLQALEKGAKTKGTKKIKPIRIKEIVSTARDRAMGINKPVKSLIKDKDRIRESTAYKKYKKILDIELKGEADYEIAQKAENKALARYFAEENWDFAVKVAKNLENPPKEILKNNISEAVIDIELEKENPDLDLLSEILTKKSLSLTRAGQEIESQSGAYNRNKASFFMEQLLQLKKKYAFKINKEKELSSKVFKDGYEKRVSKEATELRKKMDLKVAKLKKVEDIINSIIC